MTSVLKKIFGFWNDFLEELAEMQKANILLVSLGLSLGALSVVTVVSPILISPFLFLAFSVFTAMITLTEIGSSKKREVGLFFFAAPSAIFMSLLLYESGTSTEDLQKYSEAITIFSLGVILASLGLRTHK